MSPSNISLLAWDIHSLKDVWDGAWNLVKGLGRTALNTTVGMVDTQEGVDKFCGDISDKSSVFKIIIVVAIIVVIICIISMFLSKAKKKRAQEGTLEAMRLISKRNPVSKAAPVLIQAPPLEKSGFAPPPPPSEPQNTAINFGRGDK